MKSKQMTREEAIYNLRTKPYKLGHALGFTKLTSLHNDWILSMLKGTEDTTLQAHRGSYKTTCVSIALALTMLIYPNDKVLFMRKTDNDVKEVVAQVKKIILSAPYQLLARAIYGRAVVIIVSNATELSTNITNDPRGATQLTAVGVNGSLTGKHFDRIFTDDIVNLQDRISTAERNHTKQIYQELQNIKNRGGRIYNTGTPWHKDDCFTIMPAPKVYDCYTTGLIALDEIERLKATMTASLFSANYELKHVADDDVLFNNPQKNAPIELATHGIAQLDCAYYGEDFTALTVGAKHEGKYYVYGRLWRKHIEEVEDEVVTIFNKMLCRTLYNELNADKGLIARDLRNKGVTVSTYTEHQNKFVKISSYVKLEWQNIVFVEGTDEAYINQICDYNENAEHDDAPDSLASFIRILWQKKEKTPEERLKYSYLL